MALKIEEIEQLLSLPHSIDVDFYEVPIETIKEMVRLYDSDLFESTSCDNRWTNITSGKVRISLNTYKKI